MGRLPAEAQRRTPNAEQALERAIKEHDIPERERFRVSAQRET
jgi:hypothetical protein